MLVKVDLVSLGLLEQVSSETHLYQLSWVKIPKPTESCKPRKDKACRGLISPEARGRSLVRSSRCLFSQRLPSGDVVLGLCLTDPLVDVSIPQIVNRAARTAHDERSCAKQR
jgi:hypothetical protein